ncbi:11834_t:CDS:2, partial [Racocetra fulgida]
IGKHTSLQAGSVAPSPNSTTGLRRQRSDVQIDPHIKAYIDELIRASTTSIISSLKQYTDTQFDRQRLWNEQLQCWQQQQLTSSIANTSASSQPQSSMETSEPQVTDTAKQAAQATGNYPSTPVLNNLIMATSKVSLQPQSLVATPEPAQLPAAPT